MLNLHLLECTVKGYDHISDLLLAKYWVITGCKYTNCTALTSISIGAGISYLPWIFEGCTNLSDIRIEDSSLPLTFEYMGERSFSSSYDDNYIRERIQL